MKIQRAILVIFAMFYLASSLSAQNVKGIKIRNLQGADLDLMNNHDPASELAHFDLLPGYQVNLFASDPIFANPVHMHWDSKGRLWVACSWAYPQLKPGEVANDKIFILEDTDNDGVADKSTVFADGLYLPTGIELANGGCYVAQSPDVFFLKDTDGDDVADVKELVLTGFGIEDSHHSISAWRRGPGGWLYFQEGIFLHAQVETQYGVVRNFNGGVYQFNPRTQELRMFCRGTGGNPWGHVFDRWGQSFMVNNPRIMYLSPATGNSGETVEVKPLIATEKQCGGDLATGSHVGDDIRGQLLTGRFKSRAVVRYELIDDGAGFSANVLKPLISSRHPNFRPVDVKIGPDGAIYVADWYNSIINHASHDFRDPRRDHDHGRIWRITHKDRPLVQKPTLVGISIDELVEHLKSPETWTRHQTRKELSERDADQVLVALESWVDTLDASDDHAAVEAMWACQNVERVSEKLLQRVMDSSDGHARSAGARMLRYWHDQLSDPIGMLARASADPFPRTRMEAVLSAGFVPQADAFAAALHSLDQSSDDDIDRALSQTTKALASYWRPALHDGKLEFSNPAHRAYAEKGAGIGSSRRLADFLRSSSPTANEIAEVQAELIRGGEEREVGTVLDALTKRSGPKSRDVAIAMLEVLPKLARSDWPNALLRKANHLDRLLKSDDEQVALLAADSIGAWRRAGNDELTTFQSGSISNATRRSLAIALAKSSTRFTGPLAEIASGDDTAMRYAALVGLAHADLNRCVELTVATLADDPGEIDPIPLFQEILQQRKGASLFADALQGAKIHPVVSTRVAAYHRETGSLPSRIAERFQSASSTSLSAKLLSEELSALTADVEKFGDAVRGELIYRRKSLSCTNCHAIGSAGPITGPNLVAVGAAAKTHYLVDSILKPNAAIAEHYGTKSFLLYSGVIQTGIVAFRNEQEVVVRDSAKLGREVRLDVEDIEIERPAPSLMPAGLADQLQSRDEFLDLAKFLSVLGKPGAYANNESPVVRKWRVAAVSSDGGMPTEESEWLPAYSMVSGVLPLDDLPQADQVIARGYVAVQVAGSVLLEFNELTGVKLFIDDREVSDLSSPIHFDRGRHALTFSINRIRRDAGLRVELKSADSTVKFQPEGGP